MYGKSFQKLYTGSLVGKGGTVFAVWGYCFTNADYKTHMVDLNPTLLSVIIGDPEDKIKKAIEFLCSKDPDSRCKEYGGARLVHQSGFTYFVVSHQHYQREGSKEHRREYFANYRREERERKADPEKKMTNLEARIEKLSEGLYTEKGKEPLWEKLVANGVDLQYKSWLEYKKLYPDINLEAVIDYTITFNANTQNGISGIWGFLVKQGRKPEFIKGSNVVTAKTSPPKQLTDEEIAKGCH